MTGYCPDCGNTDCVCKAAAAACLLVHGGGNPKTPEQDVAGVRTVLRMQLTDEQRERIGISDDRDLAQCVMRLCDALTAAEAAMASGYGG